MPNHIHLILTLTEPTNFKQFQLGLLRYTVKATIRDMKEKEETDELLYYKSTQADRQIQIWERRPKWIPVINQAIYLQKIEYICLNLFQ